MGTWPLLTHMYMTFFQVGLAPWFGACIFFTWMNLKTNKNTVARMDNVSPKISNCCSVTEIVLKVLPIIPQIVSASRLLILVQNIAVLMGTIAMLPCLEVCIF